VSALVFELSKVETPHIREGVLGHLLNIDETLGERVADGLGMDLPKPPQPAVAVQDLPESPAVGLIEKAVSTLKGRTIAVLIADGSDGGELKALERAAEKEGARLVVVGPKIANLLLDDGTTKDPDAKLEASPSCMFDAVVVLLSKEGCELLTRNPAAVDFVRDAYGHLKAIGASKEALPLLKKAAVDPGPGVVHPLDLADFLEQAKARFWGREALLRPVL
jgi:catalase